MSNIIDTTALNVLCKTAHRGTDASDFYHSKVYRVKDAIDALTRKGYHIQTRKVKGTNNESAMCWFIDLKQIQRTAVEKKLAAIQARTPRSS